MTDALLPVTVVGGYLGAGKTTLVNHVLRESTRPVAVLVNDFGDLDVDASLLVGNDGDVLSFANGCICCDLSDGLLAALDRIRNASPAPDRVLIEASGVGELGTIANYASLPGLRLDATVCVVDAESIHEHLADRWVGDLVVGQVRDADLVVCNKADLVDEDRRRAAHLAIAAVAPDARVLDAERGRLDLDVLLGPASTTGSEPTSGSDDHVDAHAHADAATRFVSWVVDLPAPVAFDALHAALDALPDAVVRAKGIVGVADGDDQRTVISRRRPTTCTSTVR